LYAKLFTSIYQGTLRGNSHGLLVFTNLLAHADSTGAVDIHPRAISDEVGLSEHEVRTALSMLESPDPESRTPDMEGRRIVRLDAHRAWGWSIVNHAKYRAIKNEEDRREQNRLAQARWREKNKQSVSKANQASDESAHTEADTEADTEAGKKVSGSALRAEPPTPPPAFDGKNHEALNGKSVVCLAANWELPEQWGIDAEALGFKPNEVLREAEKLRQWATEGKGKGTRRNVKGWRQTWSNWLEKAARDHR
jgi:hypothetical protein